VHGIAKLALPVLDQDMVLIHLRLELVWDLQMDMEYKLVKVEVLAIQILITISVMQEAECPSREIHPFSVLQAL
jgi:hypothetical protein